MKVSKKLVLLIIVIILIIAIDQIIKFSVFYNLYNSSIGVINGILNLTYVQNTGGAFGIASNNIIIFILVNLVIIGMLLRFVLIKIKELNNLEIISISLIISGGIGNLIDRVFRGYVIDYIDISPIISYPVFNFADICIVIGVIIIAVDLIINRKSMQVK